MKNVIALIIGLCVAPVFAGGNVIVHRQEYGTGQPSQVGVEQAFKLPDGTYHTPQYLPGYPTSSTIFPRIVEVECVKQESGNLNCVGYNWSPDMGRAEYLLIRPRVKELTTPIVIERKVEVIKEVPAKKIRE